MKSSDEATERRSDEGGDERGAKDQGLRQAAKFTTDQLSMAIRVEQDGDDVLVWIKVVPGASRDEIAGVMDDRLKVRVSAAPEAGKANLATCRLLAERLGIRAKRIAVTSGLTSRQKIVRIRGATLAAVVSALAGTASG